MPDVSQGKDNSGGPVAMAQTAIGTVYLYEAAQDDVRAYPGPPELDAMGRVRRLLPRIASRGAAGPLDDDHMARLGDDEVERVIEQYLASPDNVRRASAVAAALKRAPGEPAVPAFDRLMRAVPHAPPVVPIPEEAVAAPVASVPPRALSWGLAAVGMGVLLSALAALFSYRAYEREQEMQAEAVRSRLALQALVNRRADEGRAQLAALRSENAALRGRIEQVEQALENARHARAAAARAEAKATRTPDRQSEAARKAAKDARTRDRARR